MLEIAAREAAVRRLRLLHRVQAPKQRGDACHQVRQADVLGQVIVGAEPQAGHGVELTVAGGQENDRQLGGTRAQFATQFEAALDIVPQIDIDDDEVRQACVEGLQCRLARVVGIDGVTLALERGNVVFANSRFVFDNRNAFGHGSTPQVLATICHITSVHCHAGVRAAAH